MRSSLYSICDVMSDLAGGSMQAMVPDEDREPIEPDDDAHLIQRNQLFKTPDIAICIKFGRDKAYEFLSN